MDDGEKLLPPPKISADDLRHCKETGDYRPVLFEWYKFVGLLANYIASIELRSPALRSIKAQHYYVLIGLLNRCSRLMLANVALSHEGRFGETTAIVDRCIFESTINILWLCTNSSDGKFRRYFANGLRTELEFKWKVRSIIVKGKRKAHPIETRMLASVENHIAASGLNEDEIASEKKLPDMASMIESLGRDRLLYIVGQRMGSHHVHGTWSSLLVHYLEENSDGGFRLRDHDCETHVNQFAFTPLTLLEAMDAFVRFVVNEPKSAKPFLELIAATEDEIRKIFAETAEGDYNQLTLDG